MSYQSILSMELGGLASNVVKPGRLTLDDSDEMRAAA